MADPDLVEDGTRRALLWVCGLTVTALVLGESYAEVPVALAASAGAGWVSGLDRLRRASSPRR